jgi:hypothetical protein
MVHVVVLTVNGFTAQDILNSVEALVQQHQPRAQQHHLVGGGGGKKHHKLNFQYKQG